jgi:hypothetical protein
MRTLWHSISLVWYVARSAATADAKNTKPNTTLPRIADMILTLKEWRGKKLYTIPHTGSMPNTLETPPYTVTSATSPSPLRIASRQITWNLETQTAN